MTHDELLEKIDEEGEFLVQHFDSKPRVHSALRAVVELHKTNDDGLTCDECTASETEWYPCPTIQAIEEQLQ